MPGALGPGSRAAFYLRAIPKGVGRGLDSESRVTRPNSPTRKLSVVGNDIVVEASADDFAWSGEGPLGEVLVSGLSGPC